MNKLNGHATLNNQLFFKVKIAETNEEREQAFKLRYEIFVEEIGYKPNHADHIKKTIQEPLDDSAIIWVAIYNEQVIATARINLCKNSDIGFYYDLYRIKELAGDAYPLNTALSNYLVVKKEFRGSPIILYLFKAVEQELIDHKIKYDFLDCEDYMLPFYLKVGYENMGDLDHPEFGYGYLMRGCFKS
jgi:hypothetical protein